MWDGCGMVVCVNKNPYILKLHIQVYRYEVIRISETCFKIYYNKRRNRICDMSGRKKNLVIYQTWIEAMH